jgi:urocanate hydratase
MALGRHRFSGELGGRLILSAPLDDPGAATSLGANIAGAALLGIDPDGERLKWGIRNGICDFFVNHLSEALRILKNEVRKKQPVSVWLQSEPRVCLAEMVDRGVQPDILAWVPEPDQHLLAELEARGAVRLEEMTEPSPFEVTWSVATAPALWLPRIDGLAAATIENPADERHRWLRFAPRYLGRGSLAQRYLRFTREEAERFAAQLRQAVTSGEIEVPVTLQIEGGGRREKLELRKT